MNHLRVLNVITLSALLILTGCFGLMPESEADEQTEPEQVQPHLNWQVESMGIIEDEWVIYYSVYDPSMAFSNFGMDTNSDGVVDYPGTNSSGFISLNLSDVTSNDLPEAELRIYDAVFIGVIDNQVINSQIITEEVEIEPVWQFPRHIITSGDAGGDITTGTDDDLAFVTIIQGPDINWTTVQFSISVDGSAPIVCDNPGQTGGGCAVDDLEPIDMVWSAGDYIYITESGQDLCNSGTCSIEITILDTQTETIIDITTAIAQ